MNRQRSTRSKSYTVRQQYVFCVSALLAVLLTVSPTRPASAQSCPPELEGGWYTELPVQSMFEVELRINEVTPGQYKAVVQAGQEREEVEVWREGQYLRFHSAQFPIAFKGVVSPDKQQIDGFVYRSATATRVTLQQEGGSARWVNRWTPLHVPLDTAAFELYIDNEGEGRYGGYFFFRDQRLPSLYGYGFACTDQGFSVIERNLGLQFEGSRDASRDEIRASAMGAMNTADLVFKRIQGEPERPQARPNRPVAVPQMDDGWTTASPASVGIDTDKIADMVQAVLDEELPLTHSILIARYGKLVVEEYFYGYDATTPHDMRSASKSLASTLIGLAIRDGHIASEHEPALSFFPNYTTFAHWDPRKSDITLEHLMRMSSGLDADDGSRSSTAREDAYQDQVAQPDWTRFILDVPMIGDPGTQPIYGSANPAILGSVLHRTVGESVEWFAERTLFAPLGIDTYIFQRDPTGVPYMGGGLYLTPRGMLKIGQLYLNGGQWGDNTVLPQQWIDQSFADYGDLQNIGNAYGYLWWHHTYEVGDEVVQSFEARGNGGQYIFVMPSLDMTVVVTAGNYRTGQTRQPERIMQEYILPAVVE